MEKFDRDFSGTSSSSESGLEDESPADRLFGRLMASEWLESSQLLTLTTFVHLVFFGFAVLSPGWFETRFRCFVFPNASFGAVGRIRAEFSVAI